MSHYGYFPGCSLEHSAAAYAESIQFVASTLDMRLETIDDWNCCGATEYIALNKLAAYSLVARTLALAERQLRAHDQPQHLIAPCSACYLNLRKADRMMQDDRLLSNYTNEALAAGHLHYDPGTIHIRHLIEVLIHDIGLSEVAQHVSNPLVGLRVAPYYGCLLSRPHYQDELDKAEYPTELDDLLRQLGAEVPDFPGKTWCCGGHMTQISVEVAYELLREILQAATDADADVMATACPMCQLNLDAYQAQVNHHFGTHFQMPIVYFTQLVALAFGAEPNSIGLGREIISARPALEHIGHPIESAAPARHHTEELPMPQARR